MRTIMISILLAGTLVGCTHLNPGNPAAGTFGVAPEAANVPHPELEPEMVLILAGPFLMGASDLGPAERLVHQVYLDAYDIGKFVVTNGQFKKFCDAVGREYPRARWTHHSHDTSAAYLLEKPSYPVVDVSWDDAVAYCQWLSQVTGKKYRLPTEAEWEKAARGGLGGKRYPWGDEAYDADGRYRANCGSEADNDNRRERDGFLFTAPVGSFPPNDYGLYDMAGNVWEWCADVYDEAYYSSSPDRNPSGPPEGEKRVIRGGSWFGGPEHMKCAARLWDYKGIRYASRGFRLAMTP